MKQVTVKRLAEIFSELAKINPKSNVILMDAAGVFLDDIVGIFTVDGLTNTGPIESENDVVIVLGDMEWYTEHHKRFHVTDNGIDERYCPTSDNLL